MLHSRDVSVCPQLENEIKLHKYCLKYRQWASSMKHNSCNSLVLMTMAPRLLNVCKQSPAALAPNSFFISLPFSFHLPKSPFQPPLLHLAFSLAIPLTPSHTHPMLQAGVAGSESTMRQTACGWSTEFVAPVWLGGCSCMNSCTLGCFWHPFLLAT